MKNYNDLIDNPTSRCACVLMLDTSSSMSGEPIAELNRGLQRFIDDVNSDDFARYAVDLGIVTFGSVARVHTPLQSMATVKYEQLHANGSTPMGEAADIALDLLRERKKEYKQNGISYYRPWLIMMTDGEPTDFYYSAAARCRKESELKKVSVFGVGIGEYCNLNKLAEFCPENRPPVRLMDVNFKEFFMWLSASLKQVSSSQPGTILALPPTNTWTVEL